MRISSLLAIIVGATLIACNEVPVGITDRPVYIRIVNSTYQTTDDENTAATAEPRAIDFLLDSSTSLLTSENILANSVFPAQGTDPAQNYKRFSQGVHTFTARLAAAFTPRTGFFTNTADPIGEFLPKLFFTGDTYYTLVVSGVAPKNGLPQQSAFLPDVLSSSVEFPLLDDNTRPPKGNDDKLMARVRVVNAVPFGANGVTTGASTMLVYFTQGTAPTAADLLTQRAVIRADYRQQGSSSFPKYVNMNAGEYIVTIAITVGSNRVILVQQPITFASGEVNTLLMQNTGFAEQPSASNHKLTVLLDAKY